MCQYIYLYMQTKRQTNTHEIQKEQIPPAPAFFQNKKTFISYTINNKWKAYHKIKFIYHNDKVYCHIYRQTIFLRACRTQN